jgi:hypothetical protein
MFLTEVISIPAILNGVWRVSAKPVHELQRQNNSVLSCVGIWTYIKHFGEKAMNITMSSL